MVKALYPYTPTTADQIATVQGEILTLIDGTGVWWKVKATTGQAGLVPSNYVETLPVAIPLAAASKSTVQAVCTFTPTKPGQMQIRAAGHEFEFVCVALDGWWRVKELDGGSVGDAPSTCFKVVNCAAKIVSASGVTETSEA
jgi:hypothetical protein